MKLNRVFPMYLRRCDNKGNYDKGKNLKFHQKFFRNNQFSKEITQCQKGISSQTALNSCLPICQRFSPYKYDLLLEGGTEKLKFFNLSLQALIKQQVQNNQ